MKRLVTFLLAFFILEVVSAQIPWYPSPLQFVSSDAEQCYDAAIHNNGGNPLVSLCQGRVQFFNSDMNQLYCAILSDSNAGKGGLHGKLTPPYLVYDSVGDTLASALGFRFNAKNILVESGSKIQGFTNPNYLELNNGELFDANATQAIAWGFGAGHNQRFLFDENGVTLLQWNAANVHLFCDGNDGTGLFVMDRSNTENIVFIGDNFAHGGQILVRDQTNTIKIQLTPISTQPAFINNTFLVGKTTDDFTGAILQVHGKTNLDNTLKIADGTQALNYVFTSDASGNGSWQFNNAGQIVAHADSTARTKAVTSLCTYTSAGLHTYRVGGYINTTAIVTDVIQVQVSYTDENGTPQTVILRNNQTGAGGLSVSTVGNFPLLDMDIRVFDGSTITIKTVFTVGGGSTTYDVGGNITFLY